MAGIDDLIAQYEAASRGGSDVPVAPPSPSLLTPLGTPGGGSGGAYQQPSPFGEEQPLQATTPQVAQPQPTQQPQQIVRPQAAVPSVEPAPLGEEPPIGTVDSLIAQYEAATPKAERGVVQNYTGGFNNELISKLHAINPGLQIGAAVGDALASIPEKGLKQAGMDLLTGKTDGLKRLLSTYQKSGVQTESDEGSTSAHIGKNTAMSVMTLAAIQAAAPDLAAKAGYSTMDYLKRAFGEGLMKHPALAALSDVVGATPGSTVGEEQYGMAGALAGGVAGQIATVPLQAALKSGVKLTGKVTELIANAADNLLEGSGLRPSVRKGPAQVGDDIINGYREAEARTRALGDTVVQAQYDLRQIKGSGNQQEIFDARHRLWALKQDEKGAAAAAEEAFNRIPEAVRGKYSQESTAIRNEFADTVYPKQYAEEQLTGDRKMVEDKIKNALGSIRGQDPKLTSQDYSERIAQGIDDAEKLAVKIEKRYWSRVPLKEKMPERTTPLNDLDDYLNEAETKFAKSQIPYDSVKNLRQLFASQSKPGEFQSLPTLQQVRSEVTAMRQARNEELAKDAPNYSRLANMNKLEALTEKWIGDAFPDNVPLQQARGFSQVYHDLFSKSEIYPFLQQGRRGQDRIRGEDVLSKLIQRPHGMQDLYDMTETLLSHPRIMGQKNAYPTALEPRQKDTLLALQDNVANGIRQAFREEVTNLEGDALKVQKVVDKWDPRIKAFSKVAGEMQDAMSQALDGVSQRKAIEGSAIAKYFESNDASKAVDKVWSHPNAPAVAKALINGEAGIGGFVRDPIALEGFRAAMTDKLFSSASRSGRPDPQAISQLLNDGRVNRLMNTVLGPDRMDRLERLVDTSLKMERAGKEDTWAYNAIWAARIAAVKVSALLPHFGAGGQLQQAALFSEMAKRQVIKMMAGGDPVTLLTEAVRNPSMERLMYSKVPQNAIDTKNQLILVRRVLRMDNGLRQAYEAVQDGELNPKKAEPATVPGPQSALAKPGEQYASVQPTLPTRAQDYAEGTRIMQQDQLGRHRGRGNPFDQGVPISPGRDYIPSNKGLDHPWNIRT